MADWDVIDETPAPSFSGVSATVRGPSAMRIATPTPATPAAGADPWAVVDETPDYSSAFRDDPNVLERALRGVASGGEKFAQTVNLVLGMPAATGIDALHGALSGNYETGARDFVGDMVTDSAQRRTMLAPNAQTEVVSLPGEVAHGVGEMLPDLGMMMATGGESTAVQPVIQQGTRQAVARALETAATTAGRASAIPSIERGADVGKDVIDRGGTPVEAGVAGTTAGAANTLANIVPASASGNPLMRALQGAISNPVADVAQTQAENAALPDRLGMDRETTARDLLISALTGAPMAMAMGERGHEGETRAQRDARTAAELDHATLEQLRAQQNPPPPAPSIVPRQDGAAPRAAEPPRAADVQSPAPPIVNPAPPAEPVRAPEAPAAAPPPDRLEAPAPQSGRVEVHATTGKGFKLRLVDEAPVAPQETSEFGQIREVKAYDGDTEIGSLLYANDGTPPTIEVNPDYQRRGVATAMLKLARQQGGMLGDAQTGVSGKARPTYRTDEGHAFRSNADEDSVTFEPVAAQGDAQRQEPPAPVADSAPVAQPVESTPATIAEDAPPLREPLPDDPDNKPFDHANHTSLKNEVRNESRALRGLSELASGETRDNQTVIEEGRKAVEENPEIGRDTVERIRNGGAVTHADEGILLAEDVRLRNARDAAQERAGDESLSPEARALAQTRAAEYESAINDLDEAARAIGTEGGRILQLRKRVIANDFTLQAMERKMRAAVGRGLAPEEVAEVKRLHDELAETRTKLEASEAAREEAEGKAAVSDTYAALVKALAGGKKAPVSSLRSKIEAREAAARKRIAERAGVRNPQAQGGALDVALLADYADIGAAHILRGVTDFADFVRKMVSDVADFAGIGDKAQREVFAKAQSALRDDARDAATVAGDIDPEAGITHKDVYDLAAAQVRAGVKGEDAVMAAVHKTLKDEGHEITEREVRRLFSEYGKARHPSQDAVKKELRELRALVQLQESIDRLEEGLLPLKSGPQRDKATEAVRAKREELGKRLKALAAGGKADPEKVKRYNELRAANLRKQIDALDREIATGEKAPRKGPGPAADANVTRLKALRDKLQGELAQATAGDRRNAAEKKALAKRIEEVEKKLRGEVPAPRDPEARVDDAEQTALRTKLEALRAQQREAGAKSARGEQLGAQIAELMQRLAGKEGPGKPDAKAESHPELVRIRDELQAQLRALESPPKDPGVRHNERMGKLLTRRIAELQQRMDAGDFEVRKRTPKPLDAEREKLAYEYAKKKHEFAKRQFEAQMAARPPLKKIVGGVIEAQNFARAVMTSLDFSALLRQGGFIAYGHPIRGSKAAWAGLKAAVSAQKEHAINDEIANRPNAPLYKRAGLHLTEHNSHDISKIEEQYVSRWVDKLPGFMGGGLLRGSQRAYTTTLNRIRADSFDALVASLSRTETPTDAEIKAIANYINVATGRGVLGPNGKFANAAPMLASVFFAPRLVASRFNLLAGQPLYGGSARTRGLIAAEYARFLMGAAVIYGLAHMYSVGSDDEDDGKIDFDPRSTNFGKITAGPNTYVDPLAGLAQVTTFVGKEASGEKITGKGKLAPIRDKARWSDMFDGGAHYPGNRKGKVPYGSDDMGDVLGRFLRTKLAPVPGAVWNAATGEDVVGNEMGLGDAAASLVVPMSMRDIKNIMVENGATEGTALVLLSLLGMGVQYRAPRDDKAKGEGE